MLLGERPASWSRLKYSLSFHGRRPTWTATRPVTPSNMGLFRVSIVFCPYMSREANGCDMLKHGSRIIPSATAGGLSSSAAAAAVRPERSLRSSKLTSAPSSSPAVEPAISRECRNTSSPPPAGAMNPKPLSWSKNLILPCWRAPPPPPFVPPPPPGRATARPAPPFMQRGKFRAGGTEAMKADAETACTVMRVSAISTALRGMRVAARRGPRPRRPHGPASELVTLGYA